MQPPQRAVRRWSAAGKRRARACVQCAPGWEGPGRRFGHRRRRCPANRCSLQPARRQRGRRPASTAAPHKATQGGPQWAADVPWAARWSERAPSVGRLPLCCPRFSPGSGPVQARFRPGSGPVQPQESPRTRGPVPAWATHTDPPHGPGCRVEASSRRSRPQHRIEISLRRADKRPHCPPRTGWHKFLRLARFQRVSN